MTGAKDNPSSYSEEVWQRFTNPAGAGMLAETDAGVVTALVRDPASGHAVRIWLQVIDGVINTARFQALGCPVTIAVASVAVEMLEGKSVAAARKLSGKSLIEKLSAPVEKTASGLLVEDAIRKALINC